MRGSLQQLGAGLRKWLCWKGVGPLRASKPWAWSLYWLHRVAPGHKKHLCPAFSPWASLLTLHCKSLAAYSSRGWNIQDRGVGRLVSSEASPTCRQSPSPCDSTWSSLCMYLSPSMPPDLCGPYVKKFKLGLNMAFSWLAVCSVALGLWLFFRLF